MDHLKDASGGKIIALFFLFWLILLKKYRQKA